MLAKQADNLNKGDKVITKNGIYQQNSFVICVEKDRRNVRWIYFYWINSKGERVDRYKRANSVYLPK